MHQSTTPSLSQTIWPKWVSRQFLTLPVTFGYSLSSEAVVMRQLKRWKRLWRRSLIRSNKRTSWGLPEDAGTVQQVHCSRRRLLRRGLEFHVCPINKSAHTKKSGNLSYAPRRSLWSSFSYKFVCLHFLSYIFMIVSCKFMCVLD